MSSTKQIAELLSIAKINQDTLNKKQEQDRQGKEKLEKVNQQNIEIVNELNQEKNNEEVSNSTLHKTPRLVMVKNPFEK